MPGMNCDVRFNIQIVVLILLSYVFFSSCSGPCWSEFFGEVHHYGYSGKKLLAYNFVTENRRQSLARSQHLLCTAVSQSKIVY